jgi:hypothetical protein
MTDGGVPILESARAGYAFMRASLRTVAPAALMFAVATALAGLTAPAPGTSAAGSEIISLIATMASILFGLAYSAFTYRLALRNDASGFFGLKIGRDESNLLGAAIVVGFFFLIVIVVCIVIFSIALLPAAAQAKVDLGSVAPGDKAALLEAFGAIFKGPGGPYLIAIALGLAGFIIWLSLRLFLVNVATIAEGRIMAFSTWGWTKGDTLRILAAAMMVLFPIALVIGLSLAILGQVLGTSGFGDAAGIFLQALAQNLFLIPAVTGLAVFLYRGLRPPNLDLAKPPAAKTGRAP